MGYRKEGKKGATTRFTQQVHQGQLTTFVYFLSGGISFVSWELFQDFVSPYLLTFWELRAEKQRTPKPGKGKNSARPLGLAEPSWNSSLESVVPLPAATKGRETQRASTWAEMFPQELFNPASQMLNLAGQLIAKMVREWAQEPSWAPTGDHPHLRQCGNFLSDRLLSPNKQTKPKHIKTLFSFSPALSASL